MGLHDPFGHLKHKLWPKEGPEVKLQFDSQQLKVRNRPNFHACRWRATYRWKPLNKGYNFASNLILITGLHPKLWCPKVAGAPTLVTVGLPLGSLGTKCHLDVGPVGNHKVYYKREGGGFPQIRVVMSFVSSNLPMARPSTKGASTMQ